MKAAVMTGIKQVELMEYPMPPVGDDDVLVQVECCGVCGSDLHYYEFGRIGDLVVEKPMILGHECAGRVVRFGKNVTGLSAGDLVAIEPGYTCGKCEYCRSGRYNLCEKVVFMATPPYDGAFCEYVSYPAEVVFKLPPEMDAVEGALLEPLNVGFHAARQGEACVGKSAAVLGSGCIGLCTVMALTAMGVREIYVADVLEKRLQMAEKVGALATINAAKENTVERVLALTGGKGVDIVIETAGAAATGKQTVELAKRGGTIVMVGLAPNSVYPFDFGTFINHELTMRSVFRYRNLYPVTIEAVRRLHLPLKEIVTDEFDLAHANEGLTYCVEHKDKTVKAIIRISQ